MRHLGLAPSALFLASLACTCASAFGSACDKPSSTTSEGDAPSALTLSTSEPPKPTAPPSTSASTPPTSPVVNTLIGSGPEAKPGNKVTVHYTGFVVRSTGELKQFESSHDKKKPYSFRLGAGAVIKGWDDGVVGMKVGGRRRLTIPPQLAYGSAGSPPLIPGNATLVFDIELLKVEP
jgi:FKBP-type peptidyl-prolyl cis-trans isomerase FkpA